MTEVRPHVEGASKVASWNALKEHIARTYKYEVLGSGAIKMELALDGGRSQGVRFGRRSLMDGEEEWAGDE